MLRRLTTLIYDKLVVAPARRRFLKAVKAANEGKIDKNAPIPGHTGEVRGQSRQ